MTSPTASRVVPFGDASSPAAAEAWELALDLFFESWRVSNGWPAADARKFRQRALTLSRLVGVAALTRCAVIVEIHLSSARQSLVDLEGELGRLLKSGLATRPSVETWVSWSTRLGIALTRWRLESKSTVSSINMDQNEPQIDS